MSEVKIEIVTPNVYERVGRTTSLIGSKRTSDESPKAYETMYANPNTKEELYNYAEEACNDLVQVAGIYVKQTSWTALASTSANTYGAYDKTFALTLEMPSGFSGTREELQVHAMNFVVNSLIYRWLMVAYPKEAEAYKTYYEANITEYRELLNKRGRPVRVKIIKKKEEK